MNIIFYYGESEFRRGFACVSGRHAWKNVSGISRRCRWCARLVFICADTASLDWVTRGHLFRHTNKPAKKEGESMRSCFLFSRELTSGKKLCYIVTCLDTVYIIQSLFFGPTEKWTGVFCNFCRNDLTSRNYWRILVPVQLSWNFLECL